ncbi:hypothetical protein KDD93_07650 [Campylobacter sp. faydin G-24]|uniref:YopX protein domain-containing protein n=1 Tax=Campylobacter anatolicus TaxID=2829105 RepID=A0ABS5HLB7_9BACT|nr:YopX family protein [Campylobacter anatolicus]MBR8464437.1 hypothetical protein [Campylobacter anatolicus]
MREIKFRVWDKATKRMLPLSHIVFDSNGEVTYALAELYYEDIEFYDDDDFEIMQYTGLKDDDDCEIYEGDIIKFHDLGLDRKGVVDFKDGSFIITDDYNEITSLSDLVFVSKRDGFKCFVIGNIYENPELLKG